MAVRDRLYNRKFRWHIEYESRCPSKRVTRFTNGHLYVWNIGPTHRAEPVRRILMMHRFKQR